MELNLGFLASHSGSNVRAILDNIRNGSLCASPRVVICNNLSARVLELAESRHVPNYCLNSRNYNKDRFDSLDEAILDVLRACKVNLVLLAGYMRKVGDGVISAYRKRILNIHPALLPKYGGRGMYGEAVHRAVLDSGDVESGASVHIVTSEYDEGRILAQCKIPRYPKDSVESLSERVLRFEHALYSQVLRDIGAGLIDLDE